MIRPQFSLRTLLIVVTILAIPCWLIGEQYRIVKVRRQFVEENSGSWARFLAEAPDGPEIAWIRRTLGDESVQNLVSFNWPDDAEMERVQKLFPEANVYRMTPLPDREIVSWTPPKK